MSSVTGDKPAHQIKKAIKKCRYVQSGREPVHRGRDNSGVIVAAAGVIVAAYLANSFTAAQ